MSKLVFKRVATFLLILLVAFSLVSCGGSASGSFNIRVEVKIETTGGKNAELDAYIGKVIAYLGKVKEWVLKLDSSFVEIGILVGLKEAQIKADLNAPPAKPTAQEKIIADFKAKFKDLKIKVDIKGEAKVEAKADVKAEAGSDGAKGDAKGSAKAEASVQVDVKVEGLPADFKLAEKKEGKEDKDVVAEALKNAIITCKLIISASPDLAKEGKDLIEGATKIKVDLTDLSVAGKMKDASAAAGGTAEASATAASNATALLEAIMSLAK